MSRYANADQRTSSGKSVREKRTRGGQHVAVLNAIELLERRVLLSAIDHSAVSAIDGGFPATGDDLSLNSPNLRGISIGATTTNTPPISDVLQLTDAQNGEETSAFAKVAQGVDSFHTTFDFTYGNSYSSSPFNGADGFMFVLQNDPAADLAVQNGGSDLAFRGMANAIGIKFDLWDNDDQPNGGTNFLYSATGLYVNGDFPGDVPRINPSSTPVRINPSYEPTIDLTKNPDGSASGMDFHANPNDIFQVDLNYDGTTLTEKVTDKTKNITETQTYLIDIPFFVGSHTAYAGFTGATGGLSAEQDIIDWNYTGTAGSGGLPLPTPNVGAGSDCNPGTALLNFNDSGAANVAGFEIDSATGAGAFSKLATVAGTATSYTASGLDPAQTYHFKIKAMGDGKASVDSPFSGVVSVTPTGAQPIDFSGGFPSASGLQFNGSARLTGAAPSDPPNVTIPPDALEITPNTRTRAASVYATSEQMIGKFDTTFDFVYPEVSSQGAAEGFTFVIQKDPSGLVALGDNAGALGYSSLQNSPTSPITNSVAIKFDINDLPSRDTTGLFTDGHDPRSQTPTPPDEIDDMTGSGVVLAAINNNVSDVYHVHLTYNGTTLHEEVDDTTAKTVFTHDYTIDIPTILGDACGWVGFTGSTGILQQNFMAQQVITKWTFTGAGTGGPKDVINDPTGGNTITLKQDGTNHAQIDWTLGAQSGSLPITDAKGLTINNTGAAADTIMLDSSNGSPLPNLLKLNGGFAINGFSATATPITGTLDIEGSHVKINYSGISLLSALQKYLKGGQILSSTTAASKLAIADVDTGKAILLQPATQGDANLDGKVSFADLVALAASYGKTGADWSMGDFNYDGKVDFADLVALAAHYGQTGPTATAAFGAKVTADSGMLHRGRRPLSSRRR